MMKTLIENYRGWEIYFDSEKENFYTSSDDWDRQNTKTSYAATKKWIDDFIKENSEFKPFLVESLDDYSDTVKQVKIIGIRKDKRFVYEGKNGEKEQFSEYNEKDYYLSNEANKSIYMEIKRLREQKNNIENLLDEQEKLLIKETLQSVKSKYVV